MILTKVTVFLHRKIKKYPLRKMSIECIVLDNIPYPTESFASLRSPLGPTKIYKNSLMFSHYGIFIILVEVGGVEPPCNKV